MSNILESVDSRTKLVGENRLELLMFRLKGRQVYALNVFKIQEVVGLPRLADMPNSHPAVCGVAYLRDKVVPVVDLSAAIGGPPLSQEENSNLIVTEYNLSIQGFLVGPVDRIINLNWDEIVPPPKATGKHHFVTALMRLEDSIVEILDVERVLAEIIPYNTKVSENVKDISLRELVGDRPVQILSVDDSPTARAQIRDTLSDMGVDIELIVASNGLSGLKLLQKWADEGVNVTEKLLMVVTDAEMPEMDGYRLTHEIRQDPRLKDLFVVMHTSLSGSFNNAMVEKVGCDGFLSKFRPDELAKVVQKRIRNVYGAHLEQ